MTLTSHSLADRVEGSVITPDHPRYDEARAAWNLLFTHRPAVVVEAAGVHDVVEAVRYAREIGAKVAVQATGHGVVTLADDAVLVLTKGLDRLDIDAEAWTATVGAGVKWDPVLEAAQAVGLAPLLGSSPDVGAVGYTLGGGFGWLGRRYGLALDHVRSFTVVLADGSVVTASDEEHTDLFWALRGAGAGSLGIVVEMEIDLVPVTKVYAGNLFYPIEMAAEVFDFYTTWTSDMTDDMTSSISLAAFPALDIVPEPLQGRAFAIVRGCHSGDPAEGAALVDQWREWTTPEFDMWGPMTFDQAGLISNDPVDPMPGVSSGRWLRGLEPAVLDAMLAAMAPGEDGPSPVLMVEIRHVGGAVARPNPGAAYAARGSERLIQAVGLGFTPEMVTDTVARIGALWTALGDHTDEGAYLNFLEGDEKAGMARGAFDPETWARLVATKHTVDPDGVFGHGLPLVD